MSRSKYLFLATVLAATFGAGLAQAQVVDPFKTSVGTRVSACASPSPNVPGCRFDGETISVLGQPPSLGSSKSVKVDELHASASMAMEVKSTSTSSDQGAVDINTLASLYRDGTPGITAAYDSDARPGFDILWSYDVRPTEDAILDVSGLVNVLSRSDGLSGDRQLIFYLVAAPGDFERRVYTGAFSDQFQLAAGHQYELELYYRLIQFDELDTSADILEIDTAHFAYAFTAAPPSDPGGGGGVPEPSAWSLMIVGFGLGGVALRCRSRHSAAQTSGR